MLTVTPQAKERLKDALQDHTINPKLAFRIVPLVKRDAREMIKEIKGYPLLEGYRGQEPANIPFLEELILKVSDFIERNPEIKELDLNPIFAYKDGAVAVDARIVLEDEVAG